MTMLVQTAWVMCILYFLCEIAKWASSCAHHLQHIHVTMLMDGKCLLCAKDSEEREV